MKQPILKGGSYTIFARIGSHNQLIIEHIEPMVEPNQVHVFLQIPQYILLTAAEVMFSIPSMQFAYTQVSTLYLEVHSCNFMIPALLFYEVNDPLLQVCYKP